MSDCVFFEQWIGTALKALASKFSIENKTIALCLNCKYIIETSEFVDALFDLVANVVFNGKLALRLICTSARNKNCRIYFVMK